MKIFEIVKLMRNATLACELLHTSYWRGTTSFEGGWGPWGRGLLAAIARDLQGLRRELTPGIAQWQSEAANYRNGQIY